MKGFKRNAKTHNHSEPSSDANRELLRPGLLIALVSLLTASAIIWFGLLLPLNQSRNDVGSYGVGANLAAQFNQAAADLTLETNAASLNPDIVSALQSQNPERIRDAEKSLRWLDGLIDAQLYLRGQAQRQTDRAAPLNFAALDMITRAERNTEPPQETYKEGQRWLIYSVRAVRETPESPPHRDDRSGLRFAATGKNDQLLAHRPRNRRNDADAECFQQPAANFFPKWNQSERKGSRASFGQSTLDVQFPPRPFVFGLLSLEIPHHFGAGHSAGTGRSIHCHFPDPPPPSTTHRE